MKRWISLLLSVVMVLSVVSGCTAKEQPSVTQEGAAELASVEIEPLGQMEEAIAVNSAFLIKTQQEMEEEQLRDCLVIEPSIDYTLQKQQDGWKLTPNQPLAGGKVYAFQMVDSLGAVGQSFAFQTQSKLEISSTYPENGAQYVPKDSGIEMTFNRRIKETAKQHFSIEPAVEGNFWLDGQLLTFYPTEPMQLDTTYTVTLSSGVQALDGSLLEQAYTFSFRVAEEPKSTSSLRRASDRAETFLPGDQVIVKYYEDYQQEVSLLDAKIYRFESAQDYAEALLLCCQNNTSFYQDTYRLDIQALPVEEVFAAQISPYRNQINSACYALLPDNLEDGWYLVELLNAENDGDWLQKFVQVGSVSTYIQSVNGSTLVWLNDAQSAEPIQQAEVEISDIATGETVQGVTDADGLVTLETGDWNQGMLRITKGETLCAVQPVELAQSVQERLKEHYSSVLYTDRTVYQSTDTIHFWGRLQPRHQDDLLPKQVTVSLGGQYEKQAEVDAEGFFFGDLAIESIRKNSYFLSIEDENGDAYRTLSLHIGDYVKPAYILTVEPEKPYYAIDEPFTFLVEAQYFDGTPVKGAELLIDSYYLDVDKQQITLDQEGKATIQARYLSNSRTFGWEGTSAELTVRSADEQDVQVSATCSVDILTSQYAIEGKVQGRDLQIRIGKIDPQKLFAPLPEGTTRFDYCTTPAQADVALTLTRIWTQKEEVGTYYDSINKVTVHNYRYSQQKEQLDARSVSVQESKTLAQYFEESEENVSQSYQMVLDGGYGVQIQTAGSFRPDHISLWGDAVYGFVSRYQNEIVWEPQKVKMGQAIPLQIYRNDQTQQNTGRVLYTVVQDEVVQQGLFYEDSFDLIMQEEFAPNIAIAGAYFDGKHIYCMQECRFYYDYEERALAIDIQTDQESYRPGDTMQISLTVTDQSGQPAAGARVCVGVVDEAVFAVQEQVVDLIGQLYASVYMPNIYAKASYVEYNLSEWDSGGKGGGSGDDMGQLRSEFVDTACFEQLTCDANGKATFQCTLPDNITDWRITAAAVCEKLAGDSLDNRVATLPFYLRPLVTEQYIEGDDICVSMEFGGSAIDTVQTVEATVQLLDLDGKVLDEKRQEVSAKERAVVNFGKQKAGQYQVTFSAKADGMSDAVLLPVNVLTSGLRAQITQEMDLQELSKLTSVRYPIDVLFYDVEQKPYLDALRWLRNQDGKRTEILAASYEAKVLYNQLLEEEQRESISYDQRLANTGGVRILPNAEPDAAIAAKMLIACPELVDQSQALELFQSRFERANYTLDQVLMSYVGLSAMQQPVLLEVRNLLKEEGEQLSDSQKLWVAVALAQLGDYSGAREIYTAMEEKFSWNQQWLSYQGETLDETTEVTAAALALHSILGREEADALLGYLLHADSIGKLGSGVLPHLEILTYATRHAARLDSRQDGTAHLATFSYTAAGETKQVSIGGKGYTTIRFGYNDWKDISFQEGEGEVYASVCYTADQLPEQSGEELATLTKTITPQQNGMTRIELAVQFTLDSPQGYYTLSDCVPSGMRLMKCSQSAETDAWVENENQQITASFYLDSPTGKDYEEMQRWYNWRIVYYVNGVLPGEYVVESATLSNKESGLLLKTDRQTIEVQP